MSQEINLYNPALATKAHSFSARSLILTLGLLALGGILVYSVALVRVGKLRAQEASGTKELAAAQARLTGIAQQFPPRRKSRALEEEISRMENEIRNHDAAIAFLKSGGVTLEEKGYSEYMRAFARQIVSGLWLSAFSIKDGKITLEGRALENDLVPRFINRLKQEPVMAGYSFDQLEMKLPAPAAGAKPPPYIEFTLSSSKEGK